MIEEHTLASSTIPGPPITATIVSHESGNDSASSLTISEYEHDSSLSEMDEEDEVFFGPMSKAELQRLHDARNIHRRSTEMLTLTPLCEDDNDAGEGEDCGNQNTISATLKRHTNTNTKDQETLLKPKVPLALQVPVQCATPEPSPMGGIGGVVRIPKSGEGEVETVKTEAAAMLIQSHFRRMLAKEACNRRRNDLRFLAMKGSISVERRRRPATATAYSNSSSSSSSSFSTASTNVASNTLSSSSSSSFPQRASKHPVTRVNGVPRVPRPPMSLHPKVPLPALPIGRNRNMAADGLGDWQDVAPLRSAAITTTTTTANMMREKDKPPVPSIPPVPQSAGIVSSPLRRGLSIRNWFHRQPAESANQTTSIPLPSRPATAVSIPTKVTTTNTTTTTSPPPSNITAASASTKVIGNAGSKAKAYFARMVSHWRSHYTTTTTTTSTTTATANATKCGAYETDALPLHQKFRSRRQYNRHRIMNSASHMHFPTNNNANNNNNDTTTNPLPPLPPSELCASHILLVPLDDADSATNHEHTNHQQKQQQQQQEYQQLQNTANLMRVDSDTASDSSATTATATATGSRFHRDGGSSGTPTIGAMGVKLNQFKSSLGSLLARSSSTLRVSEHTLHQHQHQNVHNNAPQTQTVSKTMCAEPLVSPGVFGIVGDKGTTAAASPSLPPSTAPIRPRMAMVQALFVDTKPDNEGPIDSALPPVPSTAVPTSRGGTLRQNASAATGIPRPPPPLSSSNAPYARSVVPRVARLASAPSVQRSNTVGATSSRRIVPPSRSHQQPQPSESETESTAAAAQAAGQAVAVDRRGAAPMDYYSSTDTDEDSGIAATTASMMASGGLVAAANKAVDVKVEEKECGTSSSGSAMAVPARPTANGAVGSMESSHPPAETAADSVSEDHDGSGASSDVSMAEASSILDSIAMDGQQQQGPGLVDSSNAKDLDNVFGSSVGAIGSGAGKDAVDSSSSSSVLGSLGIQSMANISPRLSLRLSSDASTFGFGLSALASLISSDDASAAAAEAKEEEKEVVVAQTGSGESKDVEAAATRVSDEVDSDRMSLDVIEDAQQQSEPHSSVSAKKEETMPKEPIVADSAREEEDMENPIHARLRSLRSRRLQQQQQQQEKERSLTMASSASAEPASKGQKSKKKPEPTAASGGPAKKKPLSKMGPLQLDRLTKLNTRRNATYMTCKIELVVVQKDGERPPSPSLVMQEKAQLRRALRGPDNEAFEYHSIYSESSGDEDAEEAEEEGGGDLRALVEHTCALTPPSSPYASADEAADGGDCAAAAAAAADVRRKPAAGRVRAGPDSAQQQQKTSDESGANKKQCCRPRVRWGSRSVLQNTWLLGRKPDAENRPGKSILAVRSSSAAADSDTEEKNGSIAGGGFVTTRAAKRSSKPPGGSVMNLIRVACIEYPDSLDDIEDLYSDDDGEKSIESDSSDEYMQPRPKKNSAAAKGKGRKTKERAPPAMAASASGSLPSSSSSLDDQDSFIPRRSSRKK
ncbi:hypothetical protein IWW48_003608 [Coemansia sp. RSA 1200]|nr:hypothetical protein IWW48_003608 [Coemansia sp. RSA 1200]